MVKYAKNEIYEVRSIEIHLPPQLRYLFHCFIEFLWLLIEELFHSAFCSSTSKPKRLPISASVVQKYGNYNELYLGCKVDALKSSISFTEYFRSPHWRHEAEHCRITPRWKLSWTFSFFCLMKLVQIFILQVCINFNCRLFKLHQQRSFMVKKKKKMSTSPCL